MLGASCGWSAYARVPGLHREVCPASRSLWVLWVLCLIKSLHPSLHSTVLADMCLFLHYPLMSYKKRCPWCKDVQAPFKVSVVLACNANKQFKLEPKCDTSQLVPFSRRWLSHSKTTSLRKKSRSHPKISKSRCTRSLKIVPAMSGENWETVGRWASTAATRIRCTSLGSHLHFAWGHHNHQSCQVKPERGDVQPFSLSLLVPSWVCQSHSSTHRKKCPAQKRSIERPVPQEKTTIDFGLLKSFSVGSYGVQQNETH